jgi:hypothetical protein
MPTLATATGGSPTSGLMLEPDAREFVGTSPEGHMTTALDRGEPADDRENHDRRDDAHSDSQRDDSHRVRTPDERGGRVQRDKVQNQSGGPSKMRTFLFIVAVGVISGTVGAMGHAYFSARQASDRARPPSGSGNDGRASRDSNPDMTRGNVSTTESTGPTTAQVPGSSSIPGIGSAQEVEELKQQIRNLNQRIAGLNERVDRLQNLLSLAVPLLQRLAPKN